MVEVTADRVPGENPDRRGYGSRGRPGGVRRDRTCVGECLRPASRPLPPEREDRETGRGT
ncbi:hypothetical protein ACMZ5F_10035 [Streptomyces rhizosphaericola]|uniref:hypothetical protein n=1 Tax=Streptomyces rhizosphaericola TaxID=2564098 RepID=UPI00048AB698